MNYDQVFKSPWRFFIVGTFEQQEIITQVWNHLKIALSQTNHKISEFGHSVLISVSGDADKKIVENIITQHHGDLLIEDSERENSIYFSLSAKAPIAQVALEVTHNMELYGQCNDYELHLRPPWVAVDISEQQRDTEYRSRYTYAQLMNLSQSESAEMLGIALFITILTAVIVYPLNIFLGFLGLVFRKFIEDKGDINSNEWCKLFILEIEEFSTKLPVWIEYQVFKGLHKRRARRVLNNPDSRIDPKTVELFLERSKELIYPQNQPLVGHESVTGATLTLGQRLGQIRIENGYPVSEDANLKADIGRIQQDEESLVFSWISFHQIHEGVAVFMDYLCSSDFKDIRYKFFCFDEL